MAFANRDTADEWWRAMSESPIPEAHTLQRISPQLYTHDTDWFNMIEFFTDENMKAISEQFIGRLFLTLDNDKDGPKRGLSALPPLAITDHISGNWSVGKK